MDPPQILTFQKWHKTNGVNFQTPLSGARGIGHDVSHVNTGGGCAWELPFPPTLPVAFPLGPATVPVSPGTKISNLDGICVWVCGRANVFLTALLQIYNSTSEDGAVADCWRTTCFHTLPKTLRALHKSYFTPIANLRTVFAYLIPGPMEHTLDTNQLEEQLGFSSKYRVEEHLLAAICFLTKRQRKEYPFGSKVGMFPKVLNAVGRVHWPSLWHALRAEGISDHMMWMLSKLYEGQSG